VRETVVASFVLRFVQEIPTDPAEGAQAWRGFIRHVQTGDETLFTRTGDALAFIGRYVDLEAVGHAGQEEG